MNKMKNDRLVFTEKSDEYLNTLLSDDTSSVKIRDPSSPYFRMESRTKINNRISAVLKNNTTPTDEYQKKIIDLASISKNSEAIQTYLMPKSMQNDFPPYMKKKIDHITKIITNTRKEPSDNNSGKLLPLNETIMTAKSNNDTQHMTTKDASNALQIKCNSLLYSENYLQRLMQRYRKYLEKNRNINLKLDNMYSSNRQMITEEKLSNEEKSKLNWENDLFGLETRYKLRYRSRIGDYHKKKYIKVWGKNNLPAVGFRDNIDIKKRHNT